MALDSSITQALTSLERAFVGRAKEPPEWLIPHCLPVLMPVLGEAAKPGFVQFRFFEIRLAFPCKSPAQYAHPVPEEGTSAVVTEVGAGRDGRVDAADERRRCVGEIVWS